MGLASSKISPIKGAAVATSAGILSAYVYDWAACKKLNEEAEQRAAAIGELPLDPSSNEAKKLILFWTAKNAFYNQLTASNFKQYAGNYLTKAGIDYDTYDFVLTKATFPSRIPGTTNPSFEQFVGDMYKRKERAFELMDEISAPERYRTQWQEVKSGKEKEKIIYSLNELDGVFGRDLVDGIIPCGQNDSFFRRIAKAFIKREQLKNIIERTFELIERLN